VHRAPKGPIITGDNSLSITPIPLILQAGNPEATGHKVTVQKNQKRNSHYFWGQPPYLGSTFVFLANLRSAVGRNSETRSSVHYWSGRQDGYLCLSLCGENGCSERGWLAGQWAPNFWRMYLEISSPLRCANTKYKYILGFVRDYLKCYTRWVFGPHRKAGLRKSLIYNIEPLTSQQLNA
jgi:hypothetical protein